MAKDSKEPSDFIVPLSINGLEGRMLRLPPKKGSKKEILFIYGSHSSIERWYGLALELNKLGAVTMPDLPGLGGMTSLYQIGLDASLDNMADYLATFIKLKYKNKKITIAGMSLGFIIVTRMLQKYPELAKKVDNLISIVGFAHGSDLKFSKLRIFFYTVASRFFVRKWPAKLFRRIALHPLLLRSVYHRTRHAREKFAEAAGDEFKRTMAVEINLWHINDVRTQFRNYLDMFSLDNTTMPVAMPVNHVAAKNDRYFDNLKVEEHMRRIFTDFEIFYTKAPNHAPTVIATAKEAAPFMPPALRKKILKS